MDSFKKSKDRDFLYSQTVCKKKNSFGKLVKLLKRYMQQNKLIEMSQSVCFQLNSYYKIVNTHEAIIKIYAIS